MWLSENLNVTNEKQNAEVFGKGITFKTDLKVMTPPTRRVSHKMQNAIAKKINVISLGIKTKTFSERKIFGKMVVQVIWAVIEAILVINQETLSPEPEIMSEL